MMLCLRQSQQYPQTGQILPVSQVTKNANGMSVHREHVKHGVDSGVKSMKQQPIILLIIISAEIGMLADIRFLNF